MTKEVELGPPVIAWFTEQRYDVYQEVPAAFGVADIVARSGPLVAVVEMKVALTFDLLAQARRWRGSAHMVWVAVPWSKADRREAERVFADAGIGVLSVRWLQIPVAGGDKLCSVDAIARPKFNRRVNVDDVVRYIQDEHRTYTAAGSRGGHHWTTFKETCKRLKAYLAEHDGALLKDAVASTEHHYASDAGARAHLAKLIEKGVVSGVEMRRDGKAKRLHLTVGAS